MLLPSPGLAIFQELHLGLVAFANVYLTIRSRKEGEVRKITGKSCMWMVKKGVPGKPGTNSFQFFPNIIQLSNMAVCQNQ